MEKIKTFPMEEMELRACLMLATAKATFILIEGKFKDEKEGRKMMEESVEEIIEITLSKKAKTS